MQPDVEKCSSAYDLVTMVDWVDEKPNVFIDFRDSPDIGRLGCYNGDALRHWANLKENIFAKWVKNPLSRQMDSSGHGGQPDPDYKYLKMYTGEFIIFDDLAKKLLKSKDPVILTANYESTERIGNLRGTFGVGELHGQAPGYRTYRLEGNIKEESIEEGTIDDAKARKKRLELLGELMKTIRHYYEEVYAIPAIENYMAIATDLEIRSLPLQMVSTQNSGPDFENDAKEIMLLYRKFAPRRLEIWPEYHLDKDESALQIIDCFSRIRYRGVRSKKNIIDTINKQQNLPKPIIPEMYVIESVLRNKFELENPRLLHTYTNNENKLRDYYRIIVERAVILNDQTVDLIHRMIENSDWGYPEDYDEYKQILSKSPKVPDTIEEMLRYYTLKFPVA